MTDLQLKHNNKKIKVFWLVYLLSFKTQISCSSQFISILYFLTWSQMPTFVTTWETEYIHMDSYDTL